MPCRDHREGSGTCLPRWKASSFRLGQAPTAVEKLEPVMAAICHPAALPRRPPLSDQGPGFGPVLPTERYVGPSAAAHAGACSYCCPHTTHNYHCRYPRHPFHTNAVATLSPRHCCQTLASLRCTFFFKRTPKNTQNMFFTLLLRTVFLGRKGSSILNEGVNVHRKY